MKRAAAKGSMRLVTEQVFLTGSGYLGSILLAWGLGPERFGVYGVILSVLVWAEQTAKFGIPQAATRIIAEGKQQDRCVEQTALVVGLLMFFGFSVIFWLGAPALARVFRVPEEAFLFRLAAIDIPLFGIYFVYRGVGLGRREFGLILGAGVSCGAVKLVAILSLVLLGFSISGAILAYIAGSIAGLVFLASRIPIKLASPDSSMAAKIFRLSIPLALSGVGMSILHNLDLWSLRALTAGAERDIGIYVAAGLVAKAPELAILPIGLVLFPLISRALASNEFSQARSYVQGAVRFLWVGLLPITVLIAMEARHIMMVLFSPDYAGGGIILSIRIFGYGFLAFIVIFLAVLKARGDFYLTVWVGFGLVALMLLLNFLFIPTYGPIGAAWCLTATTGAGAALTGVLVYWRFGALLALPPFIKALVATALMVWVGAQGPTTGFLLVPKWAGLVAFYAVVLWLLGELKRQDLEPLLFWR
jgi:O-antigen/teichoic acid export membrane protein